MPGGGGVQSPSISYVVHFRDIAMYGQWPGIKENLVCLAMALITFAIGFLVFKRTEKKFILYVYGGPYARKTSTHLRSATLSSRVPELDTPSPVIVDVGHASIVFDTGQRAAEQPEGIRHRPGASRADVQGVPRASGGVSFTVAQRRCVRRSSARTARASPPC